MYIADIYPGEEKAIDEPVASLLSQLQDLFDGSPLWLILQSDILDKDANNLDWLSDDLFDQFLNKSSQISSKNPALLLIDSPGGYSRVAYRISRLFNRRAGFIAIIPRYAKSASTLLSLGSEYIYMGKDAELGPLDAQLPDVDREGIISALDEVHALEQLNNNALSICIDTLNQLLEATRKKTEFVLPHALEYSANFVRPLLENVDAVHYTQMARVLRVAEDYAIRLLILGQKHSFDNARAIARFLVQRYAEHEFAIDYREADGLNLKVKMASPKLSEIFTELIPYLNGGINLVGQFTKKEEPQNNNKISNTKKAKKTAKTPKKPSKTVRSKT